MTSRTIKLSGVVASLLVVGGISYLFRPWNIVKRLQEPPNHMQVDQGDVEQESPVVVTETVQRSESDQGPILRVPKAISTPIVKKMSGHILAGSPLDEIQWEMASVDGKSIDVLPEGHDATNFQIINNNLAINMRLGYQIKIETPVSQPVLEGWYLAGSVIVTVSDGQKFVIDFSALIRFKANPTADFPDTVNAETATVTWRWSGTTSAEQAPAGADEEPRK